MKVALVTCARLPELWSDHQFTIPEFEARGVEVEVVVWDDPKVSWSQYDRIVVQSIWDYFEKSPAFFSWLTSLENAPIINPVDVLRWNADKHYLRKISSWGIPIVPTDIVDQPARFAGAKFRSDRYVTKPAISANAIDTFVVEARDLIDRVVQYNTPVLVQPYRPEIERGELSTLFFGGVYSHCVRKTPKDGDYRVQGGYGGTVIAHDPTDIELAAFTHAAAILHERLRLAYVRIDGLMVDGKLEVMEIEAIEPELFLAHAPLSAHRYVEAILQF